MSGGDHHGPGSTTFGELFGLTTAEVASELGIGAGDFFILVLTRSEPPALLAGLVFVAMFEELCMLMAAAMSTGVAVRLIEAIESGNASEAASSRLGILLSAFVSLTVGTLVLVVAQPYLVRAAGLEGDAIAIIDDAVLPMCIALIPATISRVLGNILSAMDAYIGLAATGFLDAIVGVSSFAWLHSFMGVRAYPWSTVIRSTAAVFMAAAMIYWADVIEPEDEDADGDGDTIEER